LGVGVGAIGVWVDVDYCSNVSCWFDIKEDYSDCLEMGTRSKRILTFVFWVGQIFPLKHERPEIIFGYLKLGIRAFGGHYDSVRAMDRANDRPHANQTKG